MRAQQTISSALMMLVLGFPAVVAAQSAAVWEIQTTQDEMSRDTTIRASRSAAVSITDSIGRSERPLLTVSCITLASTNERRLQVAVRFSSNLFAAYNGDEAELRIDDGPVRNTDWTASESRRTLYYRGTVLDLIAAAGTSEYRSAALRTRLNLALAQELRAASALHIRFHPPLSAPAYTRFDLNGSEQALATIISACSDPSE